MRLDKEHGLRFETYWTPEVPDPVDRRAYIERNNELLAEALELTRPHRYDKVILMSGGLDSRRLGVAAHAIGLPIRFATQETVGATGSYDRDIRLAERVSEILDVPIVTKKYPSAVTSYNDSLIRDYWLGFETHSHEWILPLIRAFSSPSLIFDGIAGDVMITGTLFRRLPQAIEAGSTPDALTNIICKRGTGLDVNPALLESSLEERVRQQLESYPESPHRLTLFYLLNHTRRNIGLQGRLYSLYGHQPCFAFLYYPLVLQSLSLRPQEYIETLIQSACLQAIHPDVSHLPSTREPEGADYLTDLSVAERRRARLFARHATLRRELVEVFPQLRGRLAALKLTASLGLSQLLVKQNWLRLPLARVSNFLDWLQEDVPAEFPVSAEGAAFLRSRLLRENEPSVS